MARPFGTFKYDNLEDLQTGIDKYFDGCKGTILKNEDGHPELNKYGEPIYIDAKPCTMTGLALALNITRQTLITYGKGECYFDSISQARELCQQYAEQRLYDRDGANGAKFSLANNYGWSERQQLDIGNKDGQPLQITTLTEIDLKIRLSALGLLNKDNAIMLDD